MQTVFEKQRRGRSVTNVKNMGSIYWQFNTDWQAPSWSGIDYSGNWKVS
jgi:beta-mannosidase